MRTRNYNWIGNQLNRYWFHLVSWVFVDSFHWNLILVVNIKSQFVITEILSAFWMCNNHGWQQWFDNYRCYFNDLTLKAISIVFVRTECWRHYWLAGYTETDFWFDISCNEYVYTIHLTEANGISYISLNFPLNSERLYNFLKLSEFSENKFRFRKCVSTIYHAAPNIFAMAYTFRTHLKFHLIELTLKEKENMQSTFSVMIDESNLATNFPFSYQSM